MAKEKKVRQSEISIPVQNQEEKEFDNALRPNDFSEFVGQKSIIDNLKFYCRRKKKNLSTMFC